MNTKTNNYNNNHSILIIITDINFKIIYKNDCLNPIINLGSSKNLLDILPMLPSFENNSTIKHTINNTALNITKSSVEIDNSKYYIMVISDYIHIEEIFNQIDILNETNHLYLEMFNKLQDGIFITDHLGKTIYVNDSFLVLSGLNKKKILGETVYDLMKKGIVPNSCCAKVLDTQRKVSTINKYYKASKCLVSGSPIFDSHGVLKNTISVIRDVSELDLLMKELADEKSMTLVYKNKIEKIEKKEKYKEFANSRSKSMENIYDQASRIADYNSTVLIQGETGVGKDFFAKYIHNISGYSDIGNYVKINCASIPEYLLESELYGYEKGAFSGAQNKGKLGLLEKANNGTLFLDEIGEMPMLLQSKLLNALNDKEFMKLGGTTPLKFNARIIVATNANLIELINNKKFRLDLYYRINVINITIPPLRDRTEDILPLVNLFLDYYNAEYNKNCYFSPEILELFLVHTWPGNIRELKNMIEKIILISKNDYITSELFTPQIIGGNSIQSLSEQHLFNGTSLKEKMESYEKRIINDSIKSTKSLSDAAKLLNIDLSTLVRKKRKYGIFKRNR